MVDAVEKDFKAAIINMLRDFKEKKYLNKV